MSGGIFNKLKNPCCGTVAEMLCGFDSNKVTAVDCTAEYLTALACINRKAFACESRCVESCFTFNNNAVKRNSFVWLDFNDTSDFNAFGRNNLFRTVNNNCCCIGTNVCKLFNVTAGCVNCSILQNFTDRKEDCYHCRLNKIAKTECRNYRNSHKCCFVNSQL